MKANNNMITDSIYRMFQDKIIKKWNKLYIAIDLHNTIAYKNGSNLSYFKDAITTLIELSKKEYIVLILFTSTHPPAAQSVITYLGKMGIKFKYLNSNPECANNIVADFSDKFYYNLLIDDRAGFNPLTEWPTVLTAINQSEIWETVQNALKI